MPAPYSQDLRTKALEAVKKEEKAVMSRMLQISRNTLKLWLLRQEKTEKY
jgi:hypothetical protein